MVMQVDQELCAGCGLCMEACSVGAIYLMDRRAVIDEALCTQCEACLDACPNGAIHTLSEPVRSLPIGALPASEPQINPALTPTVLSKTAAPTRGLAPLLGAALAFLGREVAPHLVEVLATTLERRLTATATSTTTLLSAPPESSTRTIRGIRRQARYRCRRNSKENHKERR